MTDIPLAEAKARLSELIVRAAAGEPIRITKRGKPVAEITGVASPRLPIDLAALEALTAGMRMQEESAGDFVRRMRDEDRY
jgi:prevent-host-death family protein